MLMVPTLLACLILPRILLQPHNPVQYHLPLATLPIHAKIRNPHALEPYRLRPRLLLPTIFPVLALSTTSLTRVRRPLPHLSRPRRAPPDLLETGLEQGVGVNLLRIGIDVCEEAGGVAGGVGGFEEWVEGADGGVDGGVVAGGVGDPVDEAGRWKVGLVWWLLDIGEGARGVE